MVTAETTGLAATFTETGTVTDGLEFEGSEMVSVALYVPGVNPVGLTAIFNVAGVRAVNAVTASQFEADAGLMETLKPMGGPLVKATACGVGVKPACTLKEREAGLTASMGPPVTVSVTGRERTGPVVGTIAILPVYAPAPKPAAFAVTVNVAGVAAAVGVTDSQPVPLTVEAAAVKFTAAPVDAMVIDCCPELFEPAVVKLNASAVGVAVTIGPAVTVKVTGICSGVPPFTGEIVTAPA